MDKIQVATSKCIRSWNQCIQEFLEKLGINEEYSGDCEIHSSPGDPLNGTIKLQGVTLGTVKTRFERSEGSLKVIVECTEH